MRMSKARLQTPHAPLRAGAKGQRFPLDMRLLKNPLIPPFLGPSQAGWTGICLYPEGMNPG